MWRQTFKRTSLLRKVNHQPRVWRWWDWLAEGEGGRFEMTVTKNGSGNWIRLSRRIAMQQGRSSI